MNKNMFNELLESVREAGEIRRGEKRASRAFHYSSLDVKGVRERIGLSQNEFSILIRVSVKTLQNWEQGRRHPRGPALALLTILNNDPKHAIKALN